MSGAGDVMLDAGVRAALEAGKPLVYVCPPAGWAVARLFAGLPDVSASDPQRVVLAPDTPDVLDMARVLRRLPQCAPLRADTGVARTARLLEHGAVRTLVTTPASALQLLELSRLPLDRAASVALLWPEAWLPGDSATVDAVLAEAPKAQRLIATGDPGAVRDVIERHARRAPVAVAAPVPEQPAAAARYVVVDEERRIAAARATLDLLNPAATLLWEPSPEDRYERWVEFAEDPTITITDTAPTAPTAPDGRRFDLALATDLPSAGTLASLAAVAGDVVVLVRAAQVRYLQRIARPLRSLRLGGPVDQARERAHALRQAVRDRIARGDVGPQLLALAPLFDEHDPALVAAALAQGAGGPPPDAPPPTPALPAWVHVQVNLGRRDRVRPADLVGALLNAVGLTKSHIGRIDIRDTHSTVEIRSEDAERAVRGLAQLTVRGRSLTARVTP